VGRDFQQRNPSNRLDLKPPVNPKRSAGPGVGKAIWRSTGAQPPMSPTRLSCWRNPVGALSPGAMSWWRRPDSRRRPRKTFRSPCDPLVHCLRTLGLKTPVFPVTTASLSLRASLDTTPDPGGDRRVLGALAAQPRSIQVLARPRTDVPATSAVRRPSGARRGPRSLAPAQLIARRQRRRLRVRPSCGYLKRRGFDSDRTGARRPAATSPASPMLVHLYNRVRGLSYTARKTVSCHRARASYRARCLAGAARRCPCLKLVFDASGRAVEIPPRRSRARSWSGGRALSPSRCAGAIESLPATWLLRSLPTRSARRSRGTLPGRGLRAGPDRFDLPSRPMASPRRSGP